MGSGSGHTKKEAEAVAAAAAIKRLDEAAPDTSSEGLLST